MLKGMIVSLALKKNTSVSFYVTNLFIIIIRYFLSGEYFVCQAVAGLTATPAAARTFAEARKL
jgi:hypothetical protein